MFTLSFMGGSLILLLLGIPFYHSREILSIDRFAIIRVVKTSLKKKHLKYPDSPEEFFSNDEGNVHLSPRIKLLRYMPNMYTPTPGRWSGKIVGETLLFLLIII